MPQVAQWFFKAAVVFLVIGIVMGIQMSMTGNHNVIGAHAHTNLLGWVTSAIFASYYAFNTAKAETRLARIHFWVYTTSVAVMVPSLYMLYLGNTAVGPLLGITSLTALASVLLFAFIVFSSAAALQAPRSGSPIAAE